MRPHTWTVSGNISIKFSQVPETAYAVQTNFATFCIITNPRQTDGCLRAEGGGAIIDTGFGEDGERADVSGDGGLL